MMAVILVPVFAFTIHNAAIANVSASPQLPPTSGATGCDRVCWADANWNYNYYDDSAGPYSFACDAAAYRRGYSTDADTCVDGNVYSATVSASGTYFQPNFQCADFVARALSQDGLIPGLNNGGNKGHFPASPSVGGYNSYYDTMNSKTYYLWNVGGLGNPTGLSDYLLDSGLATNIHQDVTQARPGDPIFFFDSNGIYYHTMIIVGVVNGQLIVDGHNMAQYHSVISASGADIYHIKATTTTPGK
jgi:hypothetical protein